jgi:hypothetical protein
MRVRKIRGATMKTLLAGIAFALVMAFTSQAFDDPDDVTVWHDFSTPQSAKDFASNSRLKEVMANAGVKGAPQIWFVYQVH